MGCVCWQCGSPTEGFQFKCPKCEMAAGFGEIKDNLNSIGTKIENVALAQKQLFEELSKKISTGFSQLATAIEWGFQELTWRVQQQTDVLLGIDQTLKTPSETQANEFRLMAEKLKERGVLDEAEEFFRKALNLNRLDYRLYIGLADTLLRQNKPLDAIEYLQKSLPHAPKDPSGNSGIQDWQSYSYRLMGHIFFCLGNFPQAAEALGKAIKFSPKYPEAHYDYAQCLAQLGNGPGCASFLRFAIALKPLYWSLCQRQIAFVPARNEVKGVLVSLCQQESNRAKGNLETCKNRLGNVSNRLGAFSQSLQTIKHAIQVSRIRPLINEIEKRFFAFFSG